MLFYGAETIKQLNGKQALTLASGRKFTVSFENINLERTGESPAGSVMFTVRYEGQTGERHEYITVYTSPFNCGWLLCGLSSSVSPERLAILELIAMYGGYNVISISACFSRYGGPELVKEDVARAKETLANNGWVTVDTQSNRNGGSLVYGMKKLSNELMKHRGH